MHLGSRDAAYDQLKSIAVLQPFGPATETGLCIDESGPGSVDFFYFDYTKRFELKRSETERERVLKIRGRIYMFWT